MVLSSYSTNFEAYDSHLQTRYFIDNVYIKTGREEDFQQAVEMAERTVALDPEHYLGYWDLGYLHEVRWIFTGDPEDAKLTGKYTRKAYRLNPGLPETNAAMGLILFRRAQYDSAVSYMKVALRLHANDWESFYLIGMNLSYLGLLPQAIRFYDKAVELNPFHIYTLTNRGILWLQIGDLDRAIADFARSYQIQPDFVSNLIGYALALIFKKEYPQADSLLQRLELLKPGPSKWYLKFTRALYFAALGEKEKALALSRWPGVLAMLGMKDEAIAAIDQKTKDQEIMHFMLGYLSLKHLAVYDNLRDDARFQNILDRERKKYEARLEKYSLIVAN